jgi:diguanylate cyclase (GGDEF)-like protein
MQIFRDANMPADEGSRVTQELAEARGELQQYSRHLTAIHRLTEAFACAPDDEEIIKALATGLPALIDTGLVGVITSYRSRVWIWSDSQDQEREAHVRRYLLRRLGPFPFHRTESRFPARRVRSRHLSLVPSPASQPLLQEQDSSLGHEVPLALGPEEAGLLLVQPNDPDRFTQCERESLKTIGAALSLALRHAEVHQRALGIALRDPLTELLNPRAFDEALTRELQIGFRYGAPACLLLLDLDFFKIVNDRLGQATGDHVLMMAAGLIRATVRESDVVGRYRGNTFAVLLPHTDRQQACFLAERLRDRIERHPFTVEAGQVRTTASIGLAAIPDTAVASTAEWMVVGHAALTDAKAQGRNCVVLHAPNPPAFACAAARRCAA